MWMCSSAVWYRIQRWNEFFLEVCLESFQKEQKLSKKVSEETSFQVVMDMKNVLKHGRNENTQVMGKRKTYSRYRINFLSLYMSKFSRHTIFANCCFQTFHGNNFRGSRVSSIAYSKILQAKFSRIARNQRKPQQLCASKIWTYTVWGGRPQQWLSAVRFQVVARVWHKHRQNNEVTRPRRSTMVSQY